jgi:ATP-dependent DNA helicase PIF1
MSISFLEVSLKDVFVAGQTYVALSRARSIEGLKVCNYRNSTVKIDEKVVYFYKCMEEEEERRRGHVGMYL